MAKSKTLTVGTHEVEFRASALLPRLYRFKFGRDMIRDLSRLQDAVKKSGTDHVSDLDAMDLTIFENLAWLMAKHADKSVPDDPDEWLDRVDGVLDVYLVFPELFELLSANMRTTSVPAKK